jgi:hypothetical protein
MRMRVVSVALVDLRGAYPVQRLSHLPISLEGGRDGIGI